MRQNDLTGPICKGMSGCEQRLKIEVLREGHDRGLEGNFAL